LGISAAWIRWQLTQIWPKSRARPIRCAREALSVQIEAASPYSTPLPSAIASCLPAEFQVNAFETAAHGRDVSVGAGAAGDRDQVRARVLDKSHARAAVPDNDVEHPRRQVLGRDLRQHHRRHRRCFRWLQHHGIPGGERGSHFPYRHEQRVIPRRDLAAHAYRLAPDSGLVTAEVFARGDAGC